jgi:hypothetical protein
MPNRQRIQVNRSPWRMQMPTLGRLAVLALLVVATVARCPAQGPNGKQPFTLAIRVDQLTFKIGSQIRLRITLTNTSGQDLPIGRAKGDAQAEEVGYRIEVLDEEGKNAPETKFQRVIKGEEDGIFVSSPIAITIQSGKTYEDAMMVNKFYDLSQPGKYTIQVQRRDPQSGILVMSNTITVTVTP